MKYILFPQDDFLQDEASREKLGGKAAALQALHASALPIPPWFVLSPQACLDSLTPEQQTSLANGSSGSIDNPFPNPDVLSELARALERLGEGEKIRVAVRSSALDEDGSQRAFAGQLESFLFVSPADVGARVAAVWRSAFSARVRAYRAAHGMTDVPQPPAVLIQKMVCADRAGVAFSADPATGQRGVAVVSAVFGLGSALVSGEADADAYRISREDRLIDCDVAMQEIAHEPDAEIGTQTVVLAPAAGGRRALTEPEALAVAGLARQAEQAFGRPQDIEWAIEDGELFLLQSRPITTLAATPDPDGALRLWDNSNIAESYGGITTPLTFSFARKAYRHVYRAFCRLVGVREKALRDHADVFDAMIGLIRGRIYYNLASWYQVLALLPGFRFNRSFMEGMMGVREGLPEDLLPDVRPASRRERLGDGARLLGSLLRLACVHRRLPQQTRRFYARLDAALAPTSSGLDRLRLDELAAEYRRLESALLTRWDAPIANDFFAMLFFGLSKKLVERWGPGDAAGLHNALLCSQGGIISVEPAQMMRVMAETAQGDRALIEMFCTGHLGEIEAALAGRPDLEVLYETYLARFSDRCLDELKLESPTLRDDPTGLFRAVGALARRLQQEALPKPGTVEKELRAQAEGKLQEALRGRPVRRAVVRRTLRHARARVAMRENLRFERTRVFGMARRLFAEMGRRLWAEGFLDKPDDVFYLEVDEILGFAEGTATASDLRGLSQVRRREFDGYRVAPPPADRFATRGAVHVHNPFVPETPVEVEPAGHVLRGLGCGPGVVRGCVRVVREPQGVALTGDEILVAERTDPGWIGLFAACRGLVVERGSLLSHAAIVARELGLPAVIALPHATTHLRDGDLVEVDGSAGTVRVLIDQRERFAPDETATLVHLAHAG